MPACENDVRMDICTDCMSTGYSKADTSTYPCKNNHSAGHKSFTKKDIENYKRQQSYEMLCIACTHLQKERLERIRKARMHASAWKCKCAMKIHSETCPLHAKRAGEVRWPGKNMNVSYEDHCFYELHGRGGRSNKIVPENIIVNPGTH